MCKHSPSSSRSPRNRTVEPFYPLPLLINSLQALLSSASLSSSFSWSISKPSVSASSFSISGSAASSQNLTSFLASSPSSAREKSEKAAHRARASVAIWKILKHTSERLEKSLHAASYTVQGFLEFGIFLLFVTLSPTWRLARLSGCLPRAAGACPITIEISGVRLVDAVVVR